MNLSELNTIIAVDPGKAGGIAVYNGETKVVKMPKELNDLREFLHYYKENYNPIAFIEKLSVRPDDVSVQGGQPNFGKMYRIQRMLADYEKLKLIFEDEGIPFCLIAPMSWQSKLKVRNQIKEEKAVRKRRYAEIAQKWFPEVKATLWNADALLILACGKYLIENEPNWIDSNLPKKVQETLL